MDKLFDIRFEGIEELVELGKKQEKLLFDNCCVAVARTTLYGIARIANDCPVDTGRLRASICGEYAGLASVDLKRGKIGDGRSHSTTKINFRRMEGQIGTNVEYALYVEYGLGRRAATKLTQKQRRYLFAVGILTRGAGGEVLYHYKRKSNQGKGFFRKNIPLIQMQLNSEIRVAIDATREGRSLGNFEG